jgi:heptosyltransferase-2
MNGKLLRFADKVAGSLLYGIYGSFSNKYAQKPGDQNVLAIKLWALGESVLILPALRSLSDNGYRISVIVTKQNKAIFEGLDFIDEVIVLKLGLLKLRKAVKIVKNLNFDTCIDFEPYTKFSAVLSYLSGAKMRIGFNNRPKLYTNVVKPIENMHAVKNFVNLINVLEKVSYPEKLEPLYFSKADENSMSAVLKRCGAKITETMIGIHAGSASSSLSRRWSEERFAKLCDKIIEKYNAKIFLVGSQNEEDINQRIISMMRHKEGAINLAGKLSLKQFFALCKKFDLFIANDSGPMHIAAAMGVKTIGLFGPNLPERYGPYGKKCMGLYKGNGIPAIMPFQGKFSENNEMSKIKVDDVLGAVEKLL